MIMKGRAPLRLPSAGLLTLAVMAVATLPAWATGTNEDRQQQAQAAQQTAQPVQTSQQPAQTVQPTQAPAQPQTQPRQVKPVPAATAAKPSPQAPATTRTTVARPSTAATHTLSVTRAEPVAAQHCTADARDDRQRTCGCTGHARPAGPGETYFRNLTGRADSHLPRAFASDGRREARRGPRRPGREAIRRKQTRRSMQGARGRDQAVAGAPGSVARRPVSSTRPSRSPVLSEGRRSREHEVLLGHQAPAVAPEIGGLKPADYCSYADLLPALASELLPCPGARSRFTR